MWLVIFEGTKAPKCLSLNENALGNQIILGQTDNASIGEIALSSTMVCDIAPNDQGTFKGHVKLYKENEDWYIKFTASENHLRNFEGDIVNCDHITDGSIYRIDESPRNRENGVLFLFLKQNMGNEIPIRLNKKSITTIGRAKQNDCCIDDVTVSKIHTRIHRKRDGYYLEDNDSLCGTLYNNQLLKSSHQQLKERDVITISATTFVYVNECLYRICDRNGFSVDVQSVEVVRKSFNNFRIKKKTTLHDTSLHINPGELVAIVGGSGAGKSTLMNVMAGYLKPTKGNVYVRGDNLYTNFNSFKKIIGYVPQQDIVYDELTVYEMLNYSAKLRLPADVDKKERNERVDKAINDVSLKDHKDKKIANLSGGQKKRVSIAVELLANPKLLFLDEPASGLDPATEEALIDTLKRLSDQGRTVILVTHSTLQLNKCNKIAFMGNDGYLTYFGNVQAALKYFKTSNSNDVATDIIEVYNKIDSADKVKNILYNARKETLGVGKEEEKKRNIALKTDHMRHLGILTSRYFSLIIHDKKRLLQIFLIPVLVTCLVSMVANGEQFQYYEMTKSLMFCLACLSAFVGLLNSIQEICKEKNQFRREYMTGLSLAGYVLSKVLVLSIFAILQAVCIVFIFGRIVGLPQKGIIISPFMEMSITTTFTLIAAITIGLFVSSVSQNPDKASGMAPVLLLPQIIFSGVIFSLSGVTEKISWFMISRWAMEAYGTTANLNDLVKKTDCLYIEKLSPFMQKEMLEKTLLDNRVLEEMYRSTSLHLIICWGILIIFIVAMILLTMVQLKRKK